MAAQPYVVGYLYEFSEPDPDEFLRPIRLRFEEALLAHELDRPVEVLVGKGLGLPEGTAKALEDAWSSLVEGGALVIIGPGNTDNALAVKPMAEARHVPTINFSGSERSRGEYCFHYQLGSLPDEGPLIARALAARSLSRVAVIRDRSPIGDEYWDYFSEEAGVLDLTVVSDQKVFPVQEDLSAELIRARDSSAQALVYLGIGIVLLPLMRAMTTAGWQTPSFTNTAGLRYYFMSPEDRVHASGWTFVDMYDERNVPLQAMTDRYQRKYGQCPPGPIVPCMYDMATLVVGGLRHATVHTPAGVKEGLERVHQLPSTCGGAGTVQGFGPWERTALKGPDYLILRQMGPTSTNRYAGYPPTYERLGT